MRIRPGQAAGSSITSLALPPAAPGQVDNVDPRGYGGRTPASEAAPGPQFSIYGNESKAS